MTTFTAMPKYEVYKDSGVEWIGEIPDDWGIKKLSHLFSNIGSGTTPATGNISFYDGNISWLQTGDLTDGVINSTSKTISERALKIHSTLKQYKAGSLVVAMYGATIGKVGLLNISTATNQACCVLEKTDSVDMRFAFYLFMGFKSNIVAMGYGGGQPNISQDLIRNLRFPFPNQQLQTAIATFLDEKTAKIDEAITIKEKQIELLKERKQIIIQQAVTQGLDPTVPMKDSGVEWIGKIPAHWEVKKLKYLGKSIIGLTYSPSDLCGENEGTLVARSSNLFEGKFKYGEKENVYVRCRIPSHLLLRKSDILICSRNGSRDLIGKCAYVSCVDEGNSFGAFTTVFRSNMNEYLFHILNSDIFKMLSGSFLTSTINQLTINNLNSIAVPLPPIPERLVIINYLSEISERFDKSMELLFKQIEKLKEYKTTLINSAVTGKIKVV